MREKLLVLKKQIYDETYFKMLKLKKNMLVEGLNKIKFKKIFYKPKKTILNKDKDSKKFFIVMKCILKTLWKRYFS